MTYMAASRTPRAALVLLGLVVSLFLLQIGALVSDVVAQSIESSPATPLAPPDLLSDVVAATAAEFRVDESGAATYSIPLYGVPGTAGVMPKLALSYSSQGGAGPVGKGWSISGLSAITRCRATTEAGDSIASSSPAPVNFTATDRYCLDGQRLVPAQSNSAACLAVSGMAVQNLRTEVESFQRVCAYTPSGGTAGVAFFTVERKDGSTSWYGDRVVSATQNLGYNGYVKSTAPGKEAFALSWAQTRFQDSTGNYIDFVYSSPSTGEHLIGEVRYTGKAVLSGQVGAAHNPYAKIQFVYGQRPAAEQAQGYVSGGLVTQKWRLDAVVSCNTMASTCLGDPTLHARYYKMAYAASVSGSGQQLLDAVQECRDSTMEVCLPATNFDWSTAKFTFSTAETSSTSFALASDHFRGYKQADINGDGRQDLAVLYLAGSGCVNGSWVVSFLGGLNGSSQAYFGNATFNCVPAKIYDRGEGAWHLFDYNGDGRDDLFVSSYNGQGWKVHPSNGVHFDMATNLIATLSPIVPSVEGKNDQVQLADLNGDGLTDIVYPSGGALRARIMARSGGTFVWGGERTISVDMASLGPEDPRCTFQGGFDCTRTTAGAPTPKTGFIQMADFNGDAASDLLIQENESGSKQIYGTPDCPYEPEIAETFPQPVEDPEGGGVILPYREESQTLETEVAEVEFVAQALPGDCREYFQTVTLHAMAVKSVTATVVTVGSVAQSAGNPHALSLGDGNGDGLTDLFARSSSNAAWAYRPNTGAGFGTWISLPVSSFEDSARFADVNGDGRTDVLQLMDSGGQKIYQALMALPAGGFGARVALPGGNAKVCTGSGCERQYATAFGDYDGDGVPDFMALGMASSTVSVYFSRALAPHSPRDVIAKVTNGLGAVTQLGYAPLTNAAVYRRESGTRNTTNWGRGSPVLDFLAPVYVVASASSSSPQAGAPNALATLYYRYANAKVQGGGRGFLGFEEIVTIDPNESGGYVTTQTLYAQGFPYTGVPLRTLKRAGTGTHGISTCLTQAVTDACFAVPGAAFQAPAGNWFSDSGQAWQADTEVASTTVTAFSPTVQAPVHVRPAESDELLRDPFTGVQTSGVLTSFTYGAYGNVASTQVDTVTGASTLTSTVITSNIYTDTPSDWMLGRLTSSTVTHRRPSRTDVVRTTTFTYAPTTGILNSETSGVGLDASQALRKQYLLDEYGNRVRVRICANPATAAACDAGVPLKPANATTVLRHARTAYDSRGRYPLATYELFSNGSAPVEKATQTVDGRDMFGQVTSAMDLNFVRVLAGSGTFGRPYYTWTQTVPGATVPGSTGLESRITYRWCGTGGVDCPTGARFRQQVEKTAAPTEWAYFDVLGRPIMKATASFNIGVSAKDASAICTRYNQAGKPVSVSNPFFLPGTVAAGPTGTGAVCSASTLKWTTTTYDVLGRPTRITKPYVGGTSTVTTAYSGLTTTITDERQNDTVQVRNGKGEITSITDANGLVTQYVYYADGSLYYVRRDAGRGIVQNVFYYDAMGRKVQQNDPDSGVSTFEYNALGELTAQEDAGANRIENSIDMRGRAWRRTVKVPDGTVESTSTFVFDTAANGAGQLASETIAGQYAGWAGVANTALSFSRGYSYDVLGRPEGSTTTIDGASYTSDVVYNTLGQVWKAQDASGRWTMNHYNARGYLLAVCPTTATSTSTGCPGSTIPTDPTMRTAMVIQEMDAWGHVVREARGQDADLAVTREYWAETGKTGGICAGNQTTCNLVNEGYAWDGAGNLTGQQKENRYFEQFTHDSLNRLTESKLTMQDGVTVNTVIESHAYDALGNLCRRSTYGWATREYTYIGRAGCGLGDAMNSAYGGGGTGTLGPHQISDLVSGTDHMFHYYDIRGNQTIRDVTTAGNDRTVLYSADSKLHQARTASGSVLVRFWYGSDGQRYKSEENGKKTLYLGNVEIVVNGGVTTTKRNVAGVMLQTVVGSTATNYYLFHNQLGSIVRIADANGASVNQLDFMSFGGRRNPDTQATNGAPPTLTSRGFTGHEHIDSLTLIHMNGRVYDAYAHRFMQPDPVVQAPESAQGWNAYTYAFNNPLVYTDATGMISWRQILGIAIAVIGTYVTMGADGGFFMKLGLAIAFGAASGYVSTGTWRGAVTGAFTAGLTFGVGWAANAYQWGTSATMAAQAVTGGVIEVLQGGNFGNGFITAGLTAAVMPQVGKIGNDVARTTVGAIVGGTISEATGGKFANGAMSGAIQAAMAGNEANDAECADCKGGIGKPVGARHQLDRVNPAWRDKLSVVQEDGVIVIRGDLTVSGPGAGYAARDVTAVWGNASGEYEGVMYRSEITMSAVKSGGDWIIRGWNKADWMRLNATLCSGVAGARVNAIGGSILQVPPVRSLWQQSGTPAHEFGHSLGLSHAPAGSSSIMSYDSVRSVTGKDIYNLVGGYQ